MDFWTVIFQIVNFLIFAGILHHLLYRPVKTMMQKRRETMESKLEEARQERQEAEKLNKEAQKQAEELDEKSDAILQNTREQAEAEKQDILQAAEEEARKQIARFRRNLNRERYETIESLAGELNDVLLHAISAILTQEGIDLNDAALDRLENQLHELDDQQRQQAWNTLVETEERTAVTCASALSDSQRKRLKAILASAFELEEVKLSLHTDAELVGGLEVTIGTLKIQAHWRQPLRDLLDQQLDKLRQELQTPDQATSLNENDEDKPETATANGSNGGQAERTVDSQPSNQDEAKQNKDNA
jgi:F-type H+-transporting ATPase subunit b